MIEKYSHIDAITAFGMPEMHDESPCDIKIEKDRMVIKYKNLTTEGAYDPEGNPLYSYDNLTITYIYAYEGELPLITCRKGKTLKWLDVEQFEKLIKKSTLESISYSIDSQRNLTLVFFAYGKNVELYISNIYSEIIYNWE